MNLDSLTIEQLRDILQCIKAEGDRNKLELVRVTGLGLDLVDIISDYASTGIKIYSTGDAFAVLLADGSVVTWGDAHFGGEIPDDIRGQINK